MGQPFAGAEAQTNALDDAALKRRSFTNSQDAGL